MIGQGGGGGGFDWLSFAERIGGINQTAYNQNAETSFSAVADPAGWTLQTGKAIGRSVIASKQRKKQNEFMDDQKANIKAQTVGQALSNRKAQEDLDWRDGLRKIMMRGIY